MADVPTVKKPPPPPDEIWVAGDPNTAVAEILLGLGREYNLDVWFNGVKLHSATREGADERPKSK